MKKNINRIILMIIVFVLANHSVGQEKKYAIVIHGGAGTMKKEQMDSVKEKAYIEKLNEALLVGEKMLKKGARGIDVVVKVIQVMEESPLFNAGVGAVFTHDGKVELDASIMDGQYLKAGAVAGITDVKSPIELAYRVMVNSPHVMLTGKGASEFAKKEGLTMVKNKYFYTEERKKALEKALENEKKQIQGEKEKHGTVGCVVLDTYGNLAAGTSTGGMTNKRYGRIGDSPIIGAGTYANNTTCAVSCTGHGEYFIRYVVAFSVSALMEYNGLNLKTASDYIVNQKLVEAGGTGGLIAIDKEGNIAMPFNTEGMFRGFLNSTGEKKIAIYKD
jgi:beta-aspartyl-peptidase (threonine type)